MDLIPIASSLIKFLLEWLPPFILRWYYTPARLSQLMYVDLMHVYPSKVNATQMGYAPREWLNTTIELEHTIDPTRVIGVVLKNLPYLARSGLLASSCSPDGSDESNLIFVNLLSQLTGLEVRVLSYACLNIQKSVTAEGLIMPSRGLYVDVPTLRTITGTDDIHRLDTELDHLRSLELIVGGFRPGATHHDIQPTALALNLFVRSQGFTGSAVEFFNVKPPIPGT